MKVTPTALAEVVLIEPRVFQDERGFFFESYQAHKYAPAGLTVPLVQSNHSGSRGGVLRGLHYQLRQPQGKLVSVVAGTVFDVAVDLRRWSPTFGRWVGVTLSAAERRQLWVPPGFAHGFCALSERLHVEYKCTAFYDPQDELALAWDDPELAIAWPLRDPLVSPKDRRAPRLAELLERLPRVEAAP
jgi:dTDP-4-dehydrorhamnose 3,5-epimerase